MRTVPAEVRQHPDLRLGKPELRFTRRNPEVTGEGQLEATAHAGALDGRHRGLLQLLQPREQLLEPALHLADLLAGGIRGEVLEQHAQVDAGAEALVARAGQHHGPERRILGRLLQLLFEPGQQLQRQRVALVRPVEGEHERAIHAL